MNRETLVHAYFLVSARCKARRDYDFYFNTHTQQTEEGIIEQFIYECLVKYNCEWEKIKSNLATDLCLSNLPYTVDWFCGYACSLAKEWESGRFSSID